MPQQQTAPDLRVRAQQRFISHTLQICAALGDTINRVAGDPPSCTHAVALSPLETSYLVIVYRRGRVLENHACLPLDVTDSIPLTVHGHTSHVTPDCEGLNSVTSQGTGSRGKPGGFSTRNLHPKGLRAPRTNSAYTLLWQEAVSLPKACLSHLSAA